MPEKDVTHALFFAPFVSSTMRIEPQWIDYNGHLNMAYYNVLFDRAVDEAFALVGLGPDYAAASNASFFAAECHIIYKRELSHDSLVRVTLQLVDFDEKRLHYVMDMREMTDGWIAATAECLSLHVDLTKRKVKPFPADISANLAVMKAAHARISRPPVVGRFISMNKNADRSQNEGAEKPQDTVSLH